MAKLTTEFPVKGTDTVEAVRYDADAGRLWINDEQYIGGVAQDVWAFRIGGYQVCEKWLRYRKGRKLKHEQIVHVQRVITAIERTIRLMNEIDALVPGWPLPSAWARAEPLPLVAESPASYRSARPKTRRR